MSGDTGAFITKSMALGDNRSDLCISSAVPVSRQGNWIDRNVLDNSHQRFLFLKCQYILALTCFYQTI